MFNKCGSKLSLMSFTFNTAFQMFDYFVGLTSIFNDTVGFHNCDLSLVRLKVN